MIVFRPFGLGLQLELVDPKCAHTKGFPHRPENALHIDVAPL